MAILPKEISVLSVAEKFDLLDALWEDLAAEAPEALSDVQSAELDRRLAEYKRYPERVVTWETVRSDVFRR